MARRADEDAEVHVLFVADGVASRDPDEVTTAMRRRRDAAVHACVLLGARPPRFLDFPDQRLDEVALLDVTQAIEAVLEELAPEIVYTHWSGDLNQDHRLVAQSVLTVTRPTPGQSVETVYGFEVLSSTEWAFAPDEAAFKPSCFVGIAGFEARKLAALHAYDEEMRDFPHARSYEGAAALARLRGGAVGLTAAEAFVVYRHIRE